jgi:hypothetical protein
MKGIERQMADGGWQMAERQRRMKEVRVCAGCGPAAIGCTRHREVAGWGMGAHLLAMRPSLVPASVVACACLTLLSSACARPAVLTAPVPAASAYVASEAAAPSVDARAVELNASPAIAEPCIECGVAPSEGEVLRAVTVRVADLKSRGGACSAYGEVLEASLASKRILVRPFMWRVGSHLASAQALSSGEIDVAREVDLLNLGRRTLDDVVHSLEHEAAHLALALPSGAAFNEWLVDARVSECRAIGTRAGGAR